MCSSDTWNLQGLLVITKLMPDKQHLTPVKAALLTSSQPEQQLHIASVQQVFPPKIIFIYQTLVEFSNLVECRFFYGNNMLRP